MTETDLLNHQEERIGVAGKRDKDELVYVMADRLAEFEDAIGRYIVQLRAELNSESQSNDPYEPLTVGLQGMIALLSEFEDFIDVEVWGQMLTVADRSTSIAHRRTRNFF